MPRSPQPVRCERDPPEPEPRAADARHAARPECRAAVGYLGTIETPQAAATVRCGSCARSGGRPPRCCCPCCRARRCCAGPPASSSQRIVYAGCGSEADRRYFGLITAAETAETEASPSCHVVAVGPRMPEHDSHLPRARDFQIACTRDPVAERCLEFPPSAEYVVGVVRGMHSLPADDCSSPSLLQMSKLAVKGDCPAMGNFARCNRPSVQGAARQAPLQARRHPRFRSQFSPTEQSQRDHDDFEQ